MKSITLKVETSRGTNHNCSILDLKKMDIRLNVFVSVSGGGRGVCLYLILLFTSAFETHHAWKAWKDASKQNLFQPYYAFQFILLQILVSLPVCTADVQLIILALLPAVSMTMIHTLSQTNDQCMWVSNDMLHVHTCVMSALKPAWQYRLSFTAKKNKFIE